MTDLSPEASTALARQILTLVDQAKGGSGRVTEDPGDDDPKGDRLRFLTTGWVMIDTAAGERVALVRPNFGQLRRLHEHLESLNDGVAQYREALEDHNLRANVLTLTYRTQKDKLRDQLAEAATAGDDDKAEALTAEYTAVRDKERALEAEVRQISQDHRGTVTALRLAWFRNVMSELAQGDVPWDDDDSWPGWIEDDTLPADLMEHWRARPLGRGSRQG